MSSSWTTWSWMNKLQQQKRVSMNDLITNHFKRFWVVSRCKEHLRYVLKGGRGSGKSFHIPLRIVTDIIEYPVSALAIRKVQNTVAKSVFAQIKAACIVMGVSHLFKFVPSKLEITYKPRGNKIYFAGADNPEKLKSIKDAEFPVAILWIEELAEFKTEDEVASIEFTGTFSFASGSTPQSSTLGFADVAETTGGTLSGLLIPDNDQNLPL